MPFTLLLQTQTNQDVVDRLDGVQTLIAILGGIFAILIGFISYWQKNLDKQIALRKQLTEALDKLVNVNMDNAKYRAGKDKESLPENYLPLLNDYRRLYLSQVGYIYDKINVKRINFFELTLIAQAYSSIDDLESAKLFFKRSIERTEEIDVSINVIERIIAQRNYANFLFQKVSIDEANAIYKELFENYSTDKNDTQILYIADTYKRWANLYKDYKKDEYIAKLKLAISEFSKLKSKNTRDDQIKKVNDMLSQVE
jgi:hypothetical protein